MTTANDWTNFLFLIGEVRHEGSYRVEGEEIFVKAPGGFDTSAKRDKAPVGLQAESLLRAHLTKMMGS